MKLETKPEAVNNANLKILTTYRIHDCPFWDTQVNFIQYIPKNKRVKNQLLKKIVQIVDDIILVFLMIKERKNYDILITYRNRANNTFAIIQSIFGKRIQHIMLNCLWALPKGRVGSFFRKLQLYLLAKSVDHFVVSASHEVSAYKEIFHLPEDKLTFIPYYYTRQALDIRSKDGNYIFVGGGPYRDYPLLLETVKNMYIECIIATKTPEDLNNFYIPKNVTVTKLPKEKYFQKMADAKAVVIPLKKGIFRSTGQRTYLDSMLMGKFTIICDSKGAHDYMTSGEEGIIVEPGNIKALKDAIEWALDPKNAKKIEQMTKKAKARAKEYSIENTMGQILSLAEKVVHESSKSKE
jgi:glycosyltransferase involved in cell wall biosynthesis